MARALGLAAMAILGVLGLLGLGFGLMLWNDPGDWLHMGPTVTLVGGFFLGIALLLLILLLRSSRKTFPRREVS